MLSDSGSENLLLMRKYGSLTEGYDKNVIYLDEIEKDGYSGSRGTYAPPAFMIPTNASTNSLVLPHKIPATFSRHIAYDEH